MKRHIVFAFLLLLVLTACSNADTPSPTSTAEVVEEWASLQAALQAAGATVDVGDSITQDFFTPQGHILTVNGADLQVFEYADATTMQSEAAQVAPDGGSVGTTMVTWMDTPHFYKTGRLIILYVGSDPAILDLLENVIGPQFAGQ